MKVSAQSTDPASLKVKTMPGTRQREKILQVFRVLDVPNDLYFIKCRSDKKTKTGSHVSFQTTITIA